MMTWPKRPGVVTNGVKMFRLGQNNLLWGDCRMSEQIQLDVLWLPPAQQLGNIYGQRRYDDKFFVAYTEAGTPYSVNQCVDMCRGKDWIPFIVQERQSRAYWAFHHLHHMLPASDSTFVSGWTFDLIRGPQNRELRRMAWKAACRAIAKHLQYVRIHGYCLESNTAGVRWVLQEMGCYYVGRYADAVEHQGQREALICNTVRKEDIAHCRERIETLFPAGHWAELELPNTVSSLLRAQASEGDTYG